MLEVRCVDFTSWHKVAYILDKVVYYKTNDGLVGHFDRSKVIFRFVNADKTIYTIKEFK